MAITMGVWGWGVGSYLTCHALHLAWWHWARPKGDLICLFALFLVVPLPGLFIQLGVAPALIHFWLSAQYLAIYPAFQASSPTLHILAALAAHPAGLEETALLANAAGVDRQQERIHSLQRGGLVKKNGALSPLGLMLTKGFLTYRAWLGLPEGEG